MPQTLPPRQQLGGGASATQHRPEGGAGQISRAFCGGTGGWLCVLNVKTRGGGLLFLEGSVRVRVLHVLATG